MGTNYFEQTNTCPTCGRSDEPVHIGKSSAGWKFSFHAEEGLPRSWAEWKVRLAEGGIVDEYGRAVTLEEFEAMLERKKDGSDHVADYGRPGDFHDPEGHPFVYGEFS